MLEFAGISSPWDGGAGRESCAIPAMLQRNNLVLLVAWAHPDSRVQSLL